MLSQQEAVCDRGGPVLIRGKAALVTAAGAGIGRAITLLYAEAAADIACTDLRPEDADQLAESCREFGTQSP